MTPSIFRGQVANRGGISVTLAIEQLKAFGVLLVAQAEFPPQLSCIRENPGPITECGHPGRIQRMLLASSNRKCYLDSEEVTVRINSTNPATMPRMSPRRYSQVVCSQRSRPTPISHPAKVAAGKTKANWLYLASCIRKLFFPVVSSPEDGMVNASRTQLARSSQCPATSRRHDSPPG